MTASDKVDYICVGLGLGFFALLLWMIDMTDALAVLGVLIFFYAFGRIIVWNRSKNGWEGDDFDNAFERVEKRCKQVAEEERVAKLKKEIADYCQDYPL